MSFLQRKTVLVLNRNWQAINVTTPAAALSMMYSETAMGIDIIDEHSMTCYKWKEWTNLFIREGDGSVRTPAGKIKIPKVIVTAFSKVPLRRPRFTLKNLWDRDQGRCQYTGKYLSANEANVDHVIPKSRGGKTTWTNCVICHKEVNSRKGDRTPLEAGLRLISQPKEPHLLPCTLYIKNKFNIREWDFFLVKQSY
jgi:hypothetical protein